MPTIYILVAILSMLTLCSCKPAHGPKREKKVRDESSNSSGENLNYLKKKEIGFKIEGRPWITQVNCIDLDKDGLVDILTCDGKLNAVSYIRQYPKGTYNESIITQDIPAPVRVEPADMDKDGDVDLLIASMGQVFPNNDKIGAVYILEQQDDGSFIQREIISEIARVTDVRAGDFDEDGQLDLAVGQFGYDQGEIRWMRNQGNWQFESEILLGLSGTVNVVVADFNEDGHQDIAAYVTQEWEEIHLFENDGHGKFADRVIYGSINEDFGGSGMIVCDLNQDDKPDLLFTNGDGFDYATPGPRPWHGVQWLENRGNGFFKLQRIGTLAGAYSPVCLDIDKDGDMDIVAISGFNAWEKPQAVSMMLYRNMGYTKFKEEVLAYYPTHLMTASAALMDGKNPAVITGGFHAYPPYKHMSRILIWEPKE